MLAGGALDPLAALGQPKHLGKGGVRPAHQLQILFRVADSGFFRHSADGARPKYVLFAKQLKGILVGAGLVLAGEIQVDSRHLIAAEAQKGLKGDIKPIFFIIRAAYRAFHVRHVRTAAIGVGGILGIVKVSVLAAGAAVVGGQRIHLGDARHKRHQGRPHRSPGAHQVAVLQRVLHQLLGRHIDHVIFTADDIHKLRVNAVYYNFRWFLSVKAMGFTPHQFLELSV